MRDSLTIWVNGAAHNVRDVWRPLTDFLRADLGLCGTKIVCVEGDCGSCSVLIGRPDAAGKQIDYAPVTGCIQYLYQLDGAHVVTVEGLTPTAGLHPIQAAMVACHGAQCGFCTPGIVIALGALGQDRLCDSAEVRRALVGNLCRCTGYQPILEAAAATDGLNWPALTSRYPPESLLPKLLTAARESLTVNDSASGLLWHKPAMLAEAAAFKAAHPDCAVICGGTDLGVRANKTRRAPRVVLSINHLPELHTVKRTKEKLTFGAALPLSRVEELTRADFPAFAAMLGWFGSPQIKNAGTLGGNIANGSPIGDTMPGLFVLNAKLELASTTNTRSPSVINTRWININEFYAGYKQNVLQPGELITRITLPLLRPDESFVMLKVSKRRDLDISTVAAAFWLRWAGPATARVITAARIALGGVAATIVRAPEAEAALVGQPLSEAAFAGAGQIARGRVQPLSDVRGSAEYRALLVENLFRKAFFELSNTGTNATEAAAPVPYDDFQSSTTIAIKATSHNGSIPPSSIPRR